MKSRRTEILPYLALAILSFAYVLCYSFSTSPFFPGSYGTDSALFQVIGKYWSFELFRMESGNTGGIPYIDFFDHKGPLIFWINAIGYRIGAIWIIQGISLFIAMLGIIDMLSVFTLSDFKKALAVFLSFSALTLFYEGGNLTEEYCLSFLCWSFSKELHFLCDGEETHRSKYAVLYGITFGVCLLTRITNAATICPGITMIGVILILRKKWGNLISNMVMFIVGLLVVTAPFAVYFAAEGALEEAIYGTIGYNLAYAANSKSQAESTLLSILNSGGLSWKGRLVECTIYICRWALYFMGCAISIKLIFDRNKKSKLRGIFYLLTIIAVSAVCLTGNRYPHYSMILVPVCGITASELLRNKGMWKIAAAAVCIVGFGILACHLNRDIDLSMDKHAYDVAEKHVDAEDKDAVCYYNMPAREYLIHDIRPCYPYFVNQDWQGGKSGKLAERIHQTFETCKAKWIITRDEENGISDILAAHYTKAYSDDGKHYYRRNE